MGFHGKNFFRRVMTKNPISSNGTVWLAATAKMKLITVYAAIVWNRIIREKSCCSAQFPKNGFTMSALCLTNQLIAEMTEIYCLMFLLLLFLWLKVEEI